MTQTSRFGVSRRENHDASEFYARFEPVEIVEDDRIDRADGLESPLLVCGDSRDMSKLPDRSVALVVTSPPYFAGKDYELIAAGGGVPESYGEFLLMLRDVFAECRRVLEPGGRIAVNVANLGRKPYRSLSADVIRILQDDLKMLLRGEIIWRKAAGATGSIAVGSFRKPSNPVLRDVTERVIVASKGRFDRAIPRPKREERGLPHIATVSKEEFFAAVLDVWEIPPAHASRVGHPAPFPLELPRRLINLYTYEDDLVLDPFAGSGTTLVAAVQSGRRAAGWDTDPGYVELARSRLADTSRQSSGAHSDSGAVECGEPLDQRRSCRRKLATKPCPAHPDSPGSVAINGRC